MPETRYRIRWKSILTDKEGTGSLPLTKGAAQEEVDRLNATYAGVLRHWSEPWEEQDSNPSPERSEG